ncbi:sodium/proline symporter PutP [Microbacterium album]|uniref:Sodium/proline symporter n=1 Tax=Microbacterium album TaxID=2053191 RepID=A0A917IES3_9MICO|nr:sodium/proline symporter PutP [Microbacterium album]GGH39291.1 sodium:proline symporter [Microbacterium album]
MSAHAWLIVALVVYFAAMIAIGVYAAVRTKSHKDYMLGGRNLPPAVAALSAGASDMSGWLVMGLPGAIYAAGLIEAWIAIGLTIGAYLNWRFVAPRLRAYTEVAGDAITIPSFFENRLRDRSRLLRVISAVIILVFFTLYVSSGMVAGGFFFESAFGGEYLVGMLLVGGVTLAYTLFGGFLGASFTDFVQGLMILAAVLVVPVMAVVALGGLGEVGTAISAEHFSMLGAAGLTGATAIAIVSSLAWGLGYFGQPHIIVRFMALRSAEEAKTARRIGMAWMILSLLGAVTAGFIGIAFFRVDGLANPETVILEMAQALMHPLVAGLVLSAVLAAIMSTISSQLIVTSSALVEDIYRVIVRTSPDQRILALLGRACVLVVAVVAMALALNPESTILELVGFAWAGFGAAFGPLILLSLFWRRLSAAGAIAGMVVGAVTVFVWPLLGTGLYEIVPGFALNLVVAVVVSRMTYRRETAVDDEFTRTGLILTGDAHATDGAEPPAPRT